MKLFRSYRQRDDKEWIKLCNFCLSKTNNTKSRLYLGTKELAALCGVLDGDEEEIRRALKPH